MTISLIATMAGGMAKKRPMISVRDAEKPLAKCISIS
jgi:hypothetical protein